MTRKHSTTILLRYVNGCSRLLKAFVHYPDSAIIPKKQMDDDIEGITVTRLAAGSPANNALGTDENWYKRPLAGILIAIGVLFTVAGVGLMCLVYKISKVDTYSAIVFLAEDRMAKEDLAKLQYTSWQKPSRSIRPFVHGSKSFEGCRILRYRRGSRPNELFNYNYYEAEYQMHDGSLSIGPAFGPRPYTSPNFLLLGTIIVAGLIPLIIGIVVRPVKAIRTEI